MIDNDSTGAFMLMLLNLFFCRWMPEGHDSCDSEKIFASTTPHFARTLVDTLVRLQMLLA